MKTMVRTIFALASLLILAPLLAACGQLTTTDANGTPPASATPVVTATTTNATPGATPTTASATPAITPTPSATDTSSPYQIDSCTTFDIGVHSQALPPTPYTNSAYGFSLYYLGQHVTPLWVVTQNASGVHFDPQGSTSGEDFTIRLDTSSSDTPEAFLRHLIGPVGSQQQCAASNINSNVNGQQITWTSIAVLVTIKATQAQTKQLYLAAKNPKTGKVLAATFTNGPDVNTNQEDFRYMFDTLSFI